MLWIVERTLYKYYEKQTLREGAHYTVLKKTSLKNIIKEKVNGSIDISPESANFCKTDPWISVSKCWGITKARSDEEGSYPESLIKRKLSQKNHVFSEMRKKSEEWADQVEWTIIKT